MTLVKGAVGVFWAIPQADEQWLILTDTAAVSDVEAQNDVHAPLHSHEEIWRTWQKDPESRAHFHIPEGILAHAFNHFPRGHIVYKTWPSARFVVYADWQLHELFLMQQIADRFNLPFGSYVSGSDPAYPATISVRGERIMQPKCAT